MGKVFEQKMRGPQMGGLKRVISTRRVGSTRTRLACNEKEGDREEKQ